MSNITPVIKENGAVQNKNTTLTKEISIALVQLILIGKGVLTAEAQKSGRIEIMNKEGETSTISYQTVNSWIQRRNVVPETGETLWGLLDRARKEVRDVEKREMDEKREGMIDAKLNRAISLKTKEKVVGMFGVVTDKETGKPLMRENVNLLREQMKNVRFLAERLYPNRYGKVERSENKHLHFSLSDLRKYEEGKVAVQ